MQALRSLRGCDLLIVPGTGLLTDFSSNPWGFPYRLLKWSVIARFCRTKILFLSVGAGPMYHPLTKRFIRAALALAAYRSYRDDYSKQFLKGIGFNVDHDPLYPDLAFSLPKNLFPQRSEYHHPKTVVGVGVKNYYGKLGLLDSVGETKHRDFVDKLATLVTWLVGNKYGVRLIIGDSSYDDKVRQDVLEALQRRGQILSGCDIASVPIASLEDLLSELAKTDIVVSPRFHNILLGLIMNKPAISLSYHEKFESLMASVGLAEYCHDIDTLDIDLVTQQIIQLGREMDQLRPQIRDRIKGHREALEEQYARIFGPNSGQAESKPVASPCLVEER